MPQVLEGGFDPQPPIRTRYLTDHGKGSVSQFLPPCRVHSQLHDKLIFTGSETCTAFLPYPIKIDLCGSFGKLGKFFGFENA